MNEKNQEIFNMLSELEEFFYYKLQNPEELSRFWGTLAEMYEDTKTMLISPMFWFVLFAALFPLKACILAEGAYE